MLVIWELFYKTINYTNFQKFSNQMDFQEKLSNFARLFYVIRALYKKLDGGTAHYGGHRSLRKIGFNSSVYTFFEFISAEM